MSCPLDCEYLAAARSHEKPRELAPESVPHREIRITEEFLARQSALITALIEGLAKAALGLNGTVDQDVREALGALVETYRTLEAGIYYESKPANAVAARVQELIQRGLEEYRKSSAERLGMATVRDADVLGALVFLQRLELRFSNGRQRGRAFIDFLRRQAGAAERSPAGESRLVVP